MNWRPANRPFHIPTVLVLNHLMPIFSKLPWWSFRLPSVKNLGSPNNGFPRQVPTKFICPSVWISSRSFIFARAVWASHLSITVLVLIPIVHNLSLARKSVLRFLPVPVQGRILQTTWSCTGNDPRNGFSSVSAAPAGNILPLVSRESDQPESDHQIFL